MASPAALQLGRFSIGTGDRFGMQGRAQLAAVQEAARHGTELTIVWNKSNREHAIVGTSPNDVRDEADMAVRDAGWGGPYFVDADHINLDTVSPFIRPSDFFTIDVADYIGQKDTDREIDLFVSTHLPAGQVLNIPGIEEPLSVTEERLRDIAGTYLFAIRQAAAIYNYIAAEKAGNAFITEVSMDETEAPQTPVDLYFILAALADLKVPAQTIAPKFTGRFNKGVDYRGDIDQFDREFYQDVCVVREAVKKFGLPATLKLSVHSGSDKFSIYPVIRKTITSLNTGVHIKTAGTTWLEELIGLAVAGADAHDFVKEVYQNAYGRFDELCRPYATVIDIDRNTLPVPDEFSRWSGEKTAAAIRHEAGNPDYDSNVRQLLHVSYKIAAEQLDRYRALVLRHETVVSAQVRDNLYHRHIVPLFL